MSALRIFVTGATGVIGRLVVPELVKRGHAVTGAGRSAAKRAELASVGAAAVELNMFDAESARRAFAGHDVVINLATHMPGSSFRMLLPWEWRENDRLRREGSAVLVDAARDVGVARFIQESFAPVYEDGGDAWIDERWPLRPARYNRTVLDAEASAARFSDAGGTGIVLRFAAFYGADTMMGDFINVVRRGWSPLPGPAAAFWSSVSHDDAATAVVAALTAPKGTYNVCDDEPLRRRAWADALAAAVGVSSPRLMPALVSRLGGSGLELMSRSERMSNASLKQASGWAPRWPSVREGFAAVVPRLITAVSPRARAHPAAR